MKYHIANKVSGRQFGVYDGATERDALDALARDAGCRDYDEACRIAPVFEDEIVVKPVIGRPTYVEVLQGCRSRGLVVGARYRVLSARDFVDGTRLKLAWVGGTTSTLNFTAWARDRAALDEDTITTMTAKFRVVERKSV